MRRFQRSSNYCGTRTCLVDSVSNRSEHCGLLLTSLSLSIDMTRPTNSRASVAAALAALGGVLVSAACSREQLAREAEARAKKWGIPAVRITRDVVYAEYGQRQLKLDVYRPPASADERVLPGIVVVRGGKWEQGDKEGFSYIAGQLAMRGFVTASIQVPDSRRGEVSGGRSRRQGGGPLDA